MFPKLLRIDNYLGNKIASLLITELSQNYSVWRLLFNFSFNRIFITKFWSLGLDTVLHEERIQAFQSIELTDWL